MSQHDDVHTKHCCAECGICKYGEDIREECDGESLIYCSVVSGRKDQARPHGKTPVCDNSHCYDAHDD